MADTGPARYVPPGMADDPANSGGTTHFGYREVPEDDKARLVRDVFDRVAPSYDLMNDLMSGFVHRLWKATLVRAVAPRKGERLLDVAGGTGDVSQRLLAAGGGVQVVVWDINPDMLGVGRDRALDRTRWPSVAHARARRSHSRRSHHGGPMPRRADVPSA